MNKTTGLLLTSWSIRFLVSASAWLANELVKLIEHWAVDLRRAESSADEDVLTRFRLNAVEIGRTARELTTRDVNTKARLIVMDILQLITNKQFQLFKLYKWLLQSELYLMSIHEFIYTFGNV